MNCTAWKASKYKVFSGPSFPAFGQSISPHSVRMRENTDQKNLVFQHFSRSADFLHAGANSRKLEVLSMILGWVWSKIGMVI